MSRTRRLAIDGPLDLQATMARMGKGRNDPTIRFAHDGVWRATLTPDGPSTLQLRSRAREILAQSWGPGSDWVLARVDDLVGSKDDRAGFRPDQHPLVARLDRLNPGVRVGRTSGVWHALVPTLLSQKVTSVQAKGAYYRILRRYGEPAPGPAGLRLPPAPRLLAEIGYHELHTLGVERRRAELLRSVARRAQELERLADVDTPTAKRRLTAVPGIGPWTAARVSFVAFGDADAVTVGDYHVADDVCWGLAGETRGTDERMLELLAPFAGHRGRVIQLLGLGGVHAPRRGPRLAPVGFERY